MKKIFQILSQCMVLSLFGISGFVMAAIDISDVISRSNQGDTVALQQLAEAYHSGEYNIEQDTGDMIKVYSPFAERGDLAAQYLLAIAYVDHSEDKKYIQWLQKSADAGFVIAQSDLGAAFVSGDTVKPNLKKAVHYLTLAAEQNNAEAQYVLGELYHEGKGVKKSFQKAESLLKLAAQQNHEHALVHLGMMFELGQGVEKDYKKAVEYYEKASELGSVQVLEYLAEIYEAGGYSLEKNLPKAQYYSELWEDSKY